MPLCLRPSRHLLKKNGVTSSYNFFSKKNALSSFKAFHNSIFFDILWKLTIKDIEKILKIQFKICKHHEDWGYGLHMILAFWWIVKMHKISTKYRIFIYILIVIFKNELESRILRLDWWLQYIWKKQTQSLGQVCYAENTLG